MGKPILCLDFDGVLHSYKSGWKGADCIPDPPVDGAMSFIMEAMEHFTVHIFSSRSNQPGGRSAMRAWIYKNSGGAPWVDDLEYPTEKPAAFLTIDDRALTFDGTWPSMETLLSFKPWNKRS
jgi:hypothetical protein